MADTEYVIDIAAKMSGEETLGQLDEYASKLTGAGKNAEFFQRALQSVGGELKAARAASEQAAAAVRDAGAEYKELEKAAVKAAKEEEKAARLGVIRPEVAAASAAASAALEKHAGVLKSLETAASSAKGKEDALSRTLENVRTLSGHANKAITGQAESLEKLRSGLSVAGPVGRLGSALLAPAQGFAKLSSEVGSSRAAMLLGAAAVSGLIVAVVALTAAAIAGVAAIAAWAVSLADANRTADLTAEGVAALHPEIAALSETFAALQAETGLSTAELTGLVKQLKAAHVTASDMPAALRAAALAETALGKGGSAEFFEQLAQGKKSVGDLSAEFATKLGPIAARQMLGLDNLSKRLKNSISGIFGSLNIEPVLAGLSTLVGLFDETSASGQTLKFLFETIFQPILDQGQRAAFVIEAFILGFEIGLVKLYIAAKPAIRAIKEFFGLKDSGLGDTLNIAKLAGEAMVPLFVAFAATVGVLVAVIGVALVGAMALALPFWVATTAAIAAVTAIIYGVVEALKYFWGLGQQVLGFLGGFGTILVEVGKSLVFGLAAGITGAAPAVLEALGGAVTAAIDKAKSLLGIHSPSKVFAEIGMHTMAGFGEGVDGGSADAQGAVTGAIQGVTSAATGAAAGASGSAPSGASFNFAGATFTFNGVKDAEQAEGRFGELLTRLLEGDASALGAPAEVA